MTARPLPLPLPQAQALTQAEALTHTHAQAQAQAQALTHAQALQGTARVPMRLRTPGPRHVAGTTLVEALVAFLVLSFGVVALTRIGSDLRLGAETARQRAEAVRWAENELEGLRSFSTVAASGAGRAYADVVPATRTIDASNGSPGSARFTLERGVRGAGVASAREVTVVVAWQDRAGGTQRVVLASLIAAADPALGGALALAPAGAPAASAPRP